MSDDEDNDDVSVHEEDNDDVPVQQQAVVVAQRRGGAAQYVRGSNSTKQSLKSASKHFNKFLAGLTPEIMDNMEQLAGARLSPNRPWTYENLNKERVPWKLMDLFGEHLSCDAKVLRGNVQCVRRIAYNTAARYFSSVRSGMIDELVEAGKRNLALSDEASMNKISRGICAKFSKDAFEDNTSLVNPHIPSSPEDVLTTAICCIWTGTSSFASFFSFYISLIQLAGRATEVAKVPWHNMSLINPKDFDSPRDKVVEIKFWRSKTANQQTCSIFSHRDTLLMDWFFALAYSMVMQTGHPTEYMFPMFAAKAVEAEGTREDPDDKESTKNKVVTHFYNNMLRDIMLSCSRLSAAAANNVGEANQLPVLNNVAPSFVASFGINPKLTSHSNKKHAVMIADEVAALNTTWVCYRAGWLKHCDHTIFEYLTANKKNDWQVGKALSGWRHIDAHGRIGGGLPPRLHPLLAHDQNGAVDNFVRSLFWRFDGPNWSDEFKCLLAASILLHLPRFVDLLLDHPEQKFGNTRNEAWNKHPFLQAVQIAASGANISRATLLEWCKVVSRDFTERNYSFIGLERVQQHETAGQGQNPQPGNQVDGRSIVSVLTHLVDTSRETMLVVQGLRDEVRESTHVSNRVLNDVVRTQVATCAEVRKLNQKVDRIIGGVFLPSNGSGSTRGLLSGAGLGAALAAEGVEGEQQGHHRQNQNQNHQATTPAQPPAAVVVLTNPYPNGLKGLTVRNLFENWHMFGHYKVIYNKEVKKEHRSAAILTIEYFTLFLLSHPPPLPAGVQFGCQPAASNWRKDLTRLVAAAWDKVKRLYAAKGKTCSENIFNFKDFMFGLSSADWPEGPRGETTFQPSTTDGASTKNLKLRTREKLVAHQNTHRLRVENKRARKRARLE